jgi:subtilisin family serine protease
MKQRSYLRLYLIPLLIATLTIQLIPSVTCGQITTAAKSSDEGKSNLKGKKKKNEKEKPYNRRSILIKKKDKDKDKDKDEYVGFGWYKRTLESNQDAKEEVKKYKKEKKDNNIEDADLNYIIKAQAIPNDALYTKQWALNNINNTDINAPEAWDIQHDASNVLVAVIDTGVDYNHPDLAANMWRNPGEIANNGIDDDNNGYVDDVYGIKHLIDEYPSNGDDSVSSGNPMDDNGHGTHVAGTIGAVGNNGIGVAGIAWNVKIMAIKILDERGSGSTSAAIAGINYAISKGAHIMNNSWGGGGYSAALQDAIKAARDAGIIFVGAAGNEESNTDIDPFYPAGYKVDNIVSVASTTVDNRMSSFSKYGNGSVDIAAPGGSAESGENRDPHKDIVSTWYIPALPNPEDELSEDLDDPYYGTPYRVRAGTSMAAPHISGALALLKAKFPSENYLQLLNRLYSSTDPMSALVGKCRTEGRLNLQKLLQTTSSKPANDAFQNAKTISNGADYFLVSGINTDATKASGEPNHAGNAGGKSVWWTWTAPKSGPVRISTRGSSFDTLLAVYTGTSITGLTSIASNNNATTADLYSTINFNAVVGTTYRIAVDGANGASGGIEFFITYNPPANDNFANATVVNTGTYTGKNFGATSEPGEPIYGSGGGHTVWYKFTPTVSDDLIVSTLTPGIDNKLNTVVAVYTGSSLSNLSLVAGNDNYTYYDYSLNEEPESLVGFKATANTTYYIAVDGAGESLGNISLSISFNKAPTVNAGADQTIQASAIAYLNADASDDGLPTVPGKLNATWRLVSVPPAGASVFFNDSRSFRTTAYFTKAGTYDLKLEVTDGATTSSDTVRITVKTNSTTSQTLNLEDFEDSTANGWTTTSGTWSVGTNGSKVYNSNKTDSLAITTVGQFTWNNYSISSKVYITDHVASTYGLGLIARYKDNNNYYMFGYESYKLRIKKVVNGIDQYLAEKDYFSLKEKLWYSLQAIVDGNNLKFYVNGELILAINDTSFSTGKAGLITKGVTASFDDVVVTSSRIGERFSSTTVPFTVAGGTWGVVSSTYQITAPSTATTTHLNTRALHNTSISGDFTLMVDASVVNTSTTWKDFDIIFGYKDTNNYYFASFNQSDSTNTHGIFKVQNGVSTQLENFGATITPETTYKVDIRRMGNLIQVYLNGTFYGEAEDSTFTSGKVGFGSKSDKAIFDNLIIY